jgi:hypothetical protein
MVLDAQSQRAGMQRKSFHTITHSLTISKYLLPDNAEDIFTSPNYPLIATSV